MTQIGRHFSLSAEPGRGVFCGQEGLFVGWVQLLEWRRTSRDAGEWQPRSAADLNRDLSKQYGMFIEIEGKMSGLATVCRALNRNDLIHAQLAMLHLQIPDPPILTKSDSAPSEKIGLARALRASGLLKVQEAWDEEKHPRWPAGSPDSVGGQFAAAGAVGEPGAEQNTPVTTAQAGAIPIPFESQIPIPPRFPPVPLAPPDISPRRELENPYPDRPECEEEWEHALKYCWKLMPDDFWTPGFEGAPGGGKAQIADELRRRAAQARHKRP